MVNHPEEDSIPINPPNQDVDIYCGPGQGPLSLFHVLVEDLGLDKHVDIEVLAVFEVVAVWEEFVYVLYDGVIILSFGLTVSLVGSSVSSIQVSIVWISTTHVNHSR